MESDILLLQFKKDLPDLPGERAAVAAVGEVAPGRIRSWHAPSAMPGLALLDGVGRVVIGGSGWSVFEDIPYYDRAARLLADARKRAIPILGICFGAQMLADVFGGKVIRDEENKEFGVFDVALAEAAKDDPLLVGLPAAFPTQCAHHDRVSVLPPDAIVLASSERCPVHVFRLGAEKIYGLQFHPERLDAKSPRPSTEASSILKRFLLL